MAYLANPNFGYVPGAPQALNWWEGPQFRMSGVLAPQPALPVAPPPPPLAATPTVQDVAVRPVAAALASTGGAEPGGGGPGGGPGGLGAGPSPGAPNPGMGPGFGQPGGDQTFSGYPGVYAQTPIGMNSQFGNVMGTAGMGVPYPGAGTALGALGGFIDASRYNGINAQYGIPGTVNPWGSAAHEILSGIGVPFTDWDLANLFGVSSARQRHEDILRTNLATVGPTTLNSSMPGATNVSSYGALQANEPHQPGAPFGNTGWAAGMDPTRGSYPAGFLDSGLQPSHGMPTEQAAQLNLDVERTIAANPEVFGSGPVDPTAGGLEPGGSFGAASTGPDPTQGGYGPGAGADRDVGGAYGPGFFKGGVVGPPGRYAAGGRVASNAAVRRGPPINLYVPEPAPPPDAIRDRDFYRGRFSPRPDLRGPIGWNFPESGALRLGLVPGTADRMQTDINPTAPVEYYDPEGEASMPGMADVPRYYGPTYAKGGPIPPASANITPAQFGLLRGIDPPGPDDQIGALQTGEGVITKKAMAKGWGGLLGHINAGTLDPAKVKGLLAAKPRTRR